MRLRFGIHSQLERMESGLACHTKNPQRKSLLGLQRQTNSDMEVGACRSGRTRRPVPPFDLPHLDFVQPHQG